MERNQRQFSLHLLVYLLHTLAISLQSLALDGVLLTFVSANPHESGLMLGIQNHSSGMEFNYIYTDFIYIISKLFYGKVENTVM